MLANFGIGTLVGCADDDCIYHVIAFLPPNVTGRDDAGAGGLAKTSFLHFSTRAIGFWRPAVHCLMGAIASDLPKTQVVARSAASAFRVDFDWRL